MRTLKMLAAAAILLAGAVTTAGADTLARPTAQQVQDMEGSFRLDDGLDATLSGFDNRLTIQVGRLTKKELFVVGPQRYATRDGALTLFYFPGVDSHWIEVELRPDLAAAAGRR